MTTAIENRVPGATGAIGITDLGMTYSNGLEALQGIGLEISAGDFVSILGPSGCGKSTLLKIIAGLATPTRGEASIDGAPPETFRSENGTGFVFQTPTLLPWRDVLSNAALPLELRGVSRTERLERARSALSRVGLGDFTGALPRELSGGMRMRAALARALVASPGLLLMDEPFGALDEITREKLNEDLLELWEKEKCTVLFVTHNVYEAVFLSRRVVVMSKRPGRIVSDVTVPFAYPRGRSLRANPDFATLTGKISALLAEAAA